MQHKGEVRVGSIKWSRWAYQFGEYYRTSPLWTPPLMAKREWGLAPFGDRMMHRHLAFSSTEELRNRLVQRPPKAVYYTTAYWERPLERKMDDKGWLGADLIFDLDGDHFPNVDVNDFPAMMDRVKAEAWKLWNDFLEPEYGFNPNYLQVTFSGHRGYHLHYRGMEVWPMDGPARREIVGHLTGQGLDLNQHLGQGNDMTGGWSGRLLKGIPTLIEKLDYIREQPKGEGKSALKEILAVIALRREIDTRLRAGEKSIEGLAKKFKHQNVRDKVTAGDIGSLGGPEGGDSELYSRIFKNLLLGREAVVMDYAGETDAAVTYDVRRLIRLPTSLHGGSGLKVTELQIERLNPDHPNSFDPLKEALAFSTEGNHDLVMTIDECRFIIGEEEHELHRGDRITVGDAAAAFLELKGWAQRA